MHKCKITLKDGLILNRFAASFMKLILPISVVESDRGDILHGFKEIRGVAQSQGFGGPDVAVIGANISNKTVMVGAENHLSRAIE
jgi:hypothetical protein